MTALAGILVAVAAVLSGLSGLTAFLTWRRQARKEDHDTDREREIGFIRATQETLLSTIETLHLEMERRDGRHHRELAALNEKMNVIQRHHVECEDERLKLTRRVRQLEAR